MSSCCRIGWELLDGVFEPSELRYDWFTEGFDTADLQEARALLEELS